ncbi:hypothetical protein P691DRAFT_803840 [Macrolepiota fuliginosa MF-IS2]|uniref:BTB domain-containing protein n=1 Tax=Macrolepiota fuliginosa MF-IS2 TaxID=1400762 RepID=A0A9P5X8Q2_9AGAR|nr:hypothetical protein P691DRAFT_803840 [Macrolepiota fuliginosa MF-IS2]
MPWSAMDSSSLTSMPQPAMDPSSSPAPTSISQVTHHDVDYYHVEPLTFRIEDTFFRVPREYLLQESPALLDVLARYQPVTDDEGVGNEGVDAKSLALPNTITTSSLRILFQVLYPLDWPADLEEGLSKDDWITLLELSKNWAMTRVREIAIEHLVPLLDDDPAFKWYLAKKYEIHDWVRPALERLIRRGPSLGNREFEMLDQETLLKLGAARESCYPVLRDTDPNLYGSYTEENTTIGHWDIRQRGEINVNLDSIIFTRPTPPEHSAHQVLVPEINDLKRNRFFYIENVVFRVEDNLYKVSNRPFTQHSPFFRRCFESRGFVKFNHHDPLVIDPDVTKTEFECLLCFFFPPKLSGEWEPSTTQWVSILRLSAKWEMDEVKNLAVQKLGGLDFGDTATKLRMAQESGIWDWFVSGMRTLVTRREPLSIHEYRVLKAQHILQVLNLRERVHHRTQHYNIRYRTYKQDVVCVRPERGEIPDSNYDLTTILIGLL